MTIREFGHWFTISSSIISSLNLYLLVKLTTVFCYTSNLFPHLYLYLSRFFNLFATRLVLLSDYLLMSIFTHASSFSLSLLAIHPILLEFTYAKQIIIEDIKTFTLYLSQFVIFLGVEQTLLSNSMGIILFL